ncbi:uncharacterized protein LOC108913397 [Anoplophora glabripennis]|uniref:uncharacterized protein LOC108913397 n=1 Tax=Anoplophora glabripennis TaxID=217634 RepID=UPI000C788967|nr:uncharacterized protein LOC108913397 [Anoplophora glabripennis]
MSLVQSLPDGDETYFIPHHGVLTTDGDRQKLRVVFDASAKANNHFSLNDTLYPGPKLQSDINNILLRFRTHEVVFTCDIRQMYRQILIIPEHRKYQLIRWRFRSSDPIQTYQLNTVTYGINSSPYLAIRTLLQLAEEGKQTFPLASAALKNDIYVDDLVCGASSIETVLQLRNQLIALLQTGCFELRKWSSNHPMVLEDIPIAHRQQQDLNFDSDSNTTVKVLGLQWHSSSDSFIFKVTPRESLCTKRSILSEVARIYDPMGFLSPLTLFAKRLLQRLWTLGIDWDTIPPDDVQKVWSQYKLELPCLGSLRIPRQLLNTSSNSCQLHAFCDASEVGYACVIYLRLTDQTNQVSVHLVIAKSKVAPLKCLSIPRLELCAAVLLSKLVNFVLTTYQSTLTFDQVVAWSDSTVALTWIRSSPHRWKSFVANRTTFIQERLAPSCWRYVPSADNPADPASRGLLPCDVLSCSLWWAGPTFLQQPPEYWPPDSVQTAHRMELEREEKSVVLLAQSQPSDIQDLLNQFSSLRKIQGILAYMLRFITKLKSQNEASGPLSASERHQALLRLVKVVQAESFSHEISAIRNNRKYPKQFQHLAPFLDDNGILRVGGRLSHSDLSFSAKHPALLPRKHRLTELIIRNHPSSYAPPMGNLPQTRISQVKPFSCVGVDYAGPFPITLGKARGAKARKAYLCLFICFATKAIHLELASDLSTDAFIGALRRFIARRGRCSRIFSDCGSNFIGANRELTKYMKLSVEAETITWNFNPPSAPHFGGLWESGVKSVKTHLSRVIGNQVLTYEELNTLLIQIESLLNSRPLCSLSSDPNDLSVLTPGHLLTMEPLTSVPDPDLSHLSLNRLSRWQLIQRMHQAFWSRWKNEYLHNLYQRSKWSQYQSFKPTNVGTLVLIKDNTAPPLKWRLGRIVDLHPGSDGIARVATVRTSQGTFKRPLIKLCALPSQ